MSVFKINGSRDSVELARILLDNGFEVTMKKDGMKMIGVVVYEVSVDIAGGDARVNTGAETGLNREAGDGKHT